MVDFSSVVVVLVVDVVVDAVVAVEIPSVANAFKKQGLEPPLSSTSSTIDDRQAGVPPTLEVEVFGDVERAAVAAAARSLGRQLVVVVLLGHLRLQHVPHLDVHLLVLLHLFPVLQT